MINKQLFDLVGVTTEDFENWCVDYGKKAYSTKAKMEFIKKIQNGKLVKRNGKIVKAGGPNDN